MLVADALHVAVEVQVPARVHDLPRLLLEVPQRALALHVLRPHELHLPPHALPVQGGCERLQKMLLNFYRRLAEYTFFRCQTLPYALLLPPSIAFS